MAEARRFGAVAFASLIAIALVWPHMASALSVSKATDTTAPADGFYRATARCKQGQHVVSGGYRAGVNPGYALASRAKGDNRWSVISSGEDPLTAFAYCAKGFEITARSKSVDVEAGLGTEYTARASCRRGEALVSGGWETVKANPEGRNLNAFESRRDGRRAWKVRGFNNSNADVAVKVYAYCIDGGALEIRSRQSEAIPHEEAGSATAACKQGESLLSGGYSTSPESDWFNSTGPDLFYGESVRAGSRSWRAKGYNYSLAEGTITAFAYCLK